MPSLDTIPGWMTALDEALFRFFLSTQVSDGELGDVAELGVYMGKSAVVIGDYVRDDELFTVVDLFEAASVDAANQDENERSYPGFTQRIFEGHYLRFHPTLPKIVRGLSNTIVEHAPHGTHRFVHIDASHLYEHVVGDIAAARMLLGASGIVVFDDIRESHTPGVAAAAWAAVSTGQLKPIAIVNTSCTRRGARARGGAMR
jgi:hypothetical protein